MVIPFLRARTSLVLVVLAGLATTLAAGCPAPNGYTVTTAVPQAAFSEMTAMHWIPGDPSHALVLERSGIVWRVNTADSTEQATVYLDVRDRMLDSLTQEEGLLGLAFAPDFQNSGRLYLHYTAPGDAPINPGGIPRKGVIARFQGSNVSADLATEARVIEFPDPLSNHNGGAIAFGPDGYLYASLGDGGGAGDPLGNGQNLGTLFGTIMRLDVSVPTGYAIPPDNPFVGVPGARGEIWAYGLRNVWRMSFDTATGALWVGDVGQGRVEEINVIVRGGNYGWSRLEGTRCYKPVTGCDPTGTIQPVVEYTHQFGCAVTGGYVYHGASLPELQGWYIYGDFCTGRVWAVNAEGERKTPIPIADTGLAISSFAQAPDGEVYAVTFDNRIVRFIRK
jgi:glucose/arabinose dehydrogenase